MNGSWIRNAILVFVLADLSLAAGCGGASVEGTYHDSDNAVTLELKGGKVGLNFGMMHIDGAYTVDGDKITIRPLEGDTSQTMVFVINNDGSLAGPQGSEMPRLVKAK
jgi:hypothetical protein